MNKSPDCQQDQVAMEVSGPFVRKTGSGAVPDDAGVNLNAASLTLEQARKAIHELQVYQIELEAQNEELRQAHVEISILKARFFDLYEQAPTGYCTVSATGLILEANLATTQLLNMPRGQLLNKAFTQCIVPQDQLVFFQLHKRLLDSHEPQSCELRMMPRGIPPIWVRLNASGTQGVNGIYACRVIIHDITEQKHAEILLRESEALFRQLYEQSPLAYQSLDDKGCFLLVNQTWLDMLGYSRNEVIGSSFAQFLHPDWRDHFRDKFPHFKAIGEVLGAEFILVHRNGKHIMVSLNGKISTDSRGVFKQTHCILHDITDRHRAEMENIKLQAQLRQSQKMESLGRLAGGVAHDFNNMLAVILGQSEIAMMQLNADEPVNTCLEEIHTAANRSAALTRQLLSFARQQAIDPKLLDLNECVQGMLTMLQCLVGKSIDLIWLPGADLARVTMDSSQFDQILINLCANARDAILGGGRITIETGKSVLVAEDCVGHPDRSPGNYVQLAVSDTGCGMDEETLEKIFEPFFTTKEAGKGTGMGLATVYGIVRQNAGFVTASSEPDRGTTFTVLLPETGKG